MAFGSEYLFQGSQNRAARNDAIFNRLMDTVRYNQQRSDRRGERAQDQAYRDELLDLKRYAMENPKQSASEKLLGSVMRYQSGQATPEDEALIQAQSAIQGQKTSYGADPYGRLIPQSQPSLWDRLQGGQPDQEVIPPGNQQSAFDTLINGMADPSAPSPDAPMNPQDFERMVMTGEAPSMVMPSEEFLNSPVGDIEAGKAYIGTQADIAKGKGMLPVKAAEKDIDVSGNVEEFKEKEEFKRKLSKADKELEKGQAREKIAKSLNDMDKFNDALKVRNAIVNNDQGTLEKLRAGFGASYFGKIYDKYADTDSQTLRESYERARDSLIPYYISVNQLPATVIDTEEFQQRILQSFGDPGLNYETNRFAIDNMRSQFGIDAQPSENRDVLIKQAQEAIKAGRDPEAVQKMLEEKLNGG